MSVPKENKDSVIIRDVEEQDIEHLLMLNEANLPHVNSLSLEQMSALWRQSSYFRFVQEDGAMLACLLVIGPGADYQSLNYRWFSERYDEFMYVDRIMVADGARRRGLASLLYSDLEDFAKLHKAPRILCEYNIVPENSISRDFHATHGFEEVGQQDTEEGTKTVSLQCKTLS